MMGIYLDPAELANNLVQQYVLITYDHEKSKQCALIAVNSHLYSENTSPFLTMKEWIEYAQYWNNVIIEINNL